MIPAAPALGAPLLSGAVFCAVSLVASARPLAIEWPEISLPALPKISLPDLDLPNFGKKKDTPAGKKAAPAARAPPSGNVRVRPATGVRAAGQSLDAPSLSDITGVQQQERVGSAEGWERFPERRMPGANMDGWKKIAKDMAPKI